jgi:hypothetical protein
MSRGKRVSFRRRESFSGYGGSDFSLKAGGMVDEGVGEVRA